MGFIAGSVRLQAQGAGKYRQQATAEWGIAGNINGGWLMAAAAKAAIAELPHAEPLAVSGQYMAPVTPGEIQLEVTPLSQGRSNSVATVKVSQQGRLACFFLVTATDFDFVKGASFEHREPLILAPWQDCSPMQSEQAPGVNRIVNLRFPPDQRWWTENRAAETAICAGADMKTAPGWMRWICCSWWMQCRRRCFPCWA